MSKDRNDYLRSQLSKSFAELQRLEDNNELILSFSDGICQLMKKTSAHQLLKSITEYEIKREIDPFHDHSGGMFTYAGFSIFFRILHQLKIAYLDIALYSEIEQIRRQRSKFTWFSLKAIADF